MLLAAEDHARMIHGWGTDQSGRFSARQSHIALDLTILRRCYAAEVVDEVC